MRSKEAEKRQGARRKSIQENRDFVDALRNFLDLSPLYGSDYKSEPERFNRTYKWPAEAGGGRRLD